MKKGGDVIVFEEYLYYDYHNNIIIILNYKVYLLLK